ncbi:hypothetical protein, partial [Asanoa sp. NPDC050611]|uniref:hypothetical protein n=1 Tax=Asanoa sp. NPDC050611 TaxID=3157098 RepID=UPI0033DB5689
IPAGFRWWYDPNGVQIAYPAGWEMLRETSDAMLFRAPDDPRTLRVSADSAAAERATARLPGYRRVDRGYVFDGADGPMRGLDTVVTARGTTYLIQWRTPRDAWQANLPKLTVITESFRPPDG